MGAIESKINEFLQEFEIDSSQLKRIADAFCQEIERGLKKEKSSFKMLKSYLQLPNGEEKEMCIRDRLQRELVKE